MDTPFTNEKAGQAFLIDPEGGPGSGVLVLHSWWGLNDWVRGFCKQLAGAGYTALAPDLFAGALPESAEEGEKTLGELDPDELSGLVISSAQTLRAASADPEKPIAVIGFSMGASLAYWISARLPHNVNSVVAYYGTQAIDFDESNSKYLGHYGDADHMISEDDRVSTESFIRLGGNETEFCVYEGAKHWFAEDGDNYSDVAATEAWQKTVSFLGENLS